MPFDEADKYYIEDHSLTQTQTKRKSVFREYAEAILVALVLAFFIRTFIVQAFKIPSGSMKSTLLIGDHILVNKFIYGVKNPFNGSIMIPIEQPAAGDVIVFEYPVDPSKDFIKRVVGVPGNKIEIKDKKVFINDHPLDDNEYAKHVDPKIFPNGMQPRDNFGPVIVPADSFFVMGDNRDESYDSRFWGFVNLKAVKGKAFILYWSWDNPNFSVRWNRLGNLIH